VRLGLAVLAVWLTACATTPKYLQDDCPIYTELGPVRANPAGAFDRHLSVEISVRVCPPAEGLAEIRRKHIELKHEVLALVSSRTEAQLADPLRIEKLQAELLERINTRIMKKGRAVQVMVTGFELE
jgi:flagellar basal body-associated protein FliL